METTPWESIMTEFDQLQNIQQNIREIENQLENATSTITPQQKIQLKLQLDNYSSNVKNYSNLMLLSWSPYKQNPFKNNNKFSKSNNKLRMPLHNNNKNYNSNCNNYR